MQRRCLSVDVLKVTVRIGLLAVTTAVPLAASQQPTAVTPRTADGKPDLGGVWGAVVPADEGFTQNTDDNGNILRWVPSRRCAPNQEGCRDNTNQSNDGEFTGRRSPNRPLYKPEHWDRVQELDYNTNFVDPQMRCQPDGVPRVGPPNKIVQNGDELIFLYAGRNRDHDFRIIPTDGRSHNPEAFPSYWGDSVGRWEGDTLVVDVQSFNDTTWLTNRGGYFHSYDLRVAERFRREGNTLHYEVTVEDPTVLLAPWVMDARRISLNTDAIITILEGLPCREYDSEITVSRIRH